MKKIILFLLTALLLYMALDLYGEQIISTITAFFEKEPQKSDEELINERIDEFLYCYNSGDFDGAVDCFDKKTRNTLKSTLNVTKSALGALAGCHPIIGMTSALNYADLFGMSVGMISDDDLLKFENRKITINNSEAYVTTKMSYNTEYYSQEVDDTIIVMKCEKGNWYISNIKNK